MAKKKEDGAKKREDETNAKERAKEERENENEEEGVNNEDDEANNEDEERGNGGDEARGNGNPTDQSAPPQANRQHRKRINKTATNRQCPEPIDETAGESMSQPGNRDSGRMV